MNDYQITYSNGQVVIINAWTPEVAQVIAEEEADQYGCEGHSVVGVELATPQLAEQ